MNPPTTNTGLERLLVVPSPKRPLVPNPQAHACPLDRIAAVCSPSDAVAPPAVAIWIQSVIPPTTDTGLRRLVIVPSPN